MRLHRGVPMLAAVVTLAGVSAPAAYGLDDISPGGGGSQAATPAVDHSAGPSDWLIGLGAAGGITLAGAGLASSRRTRRRTGSAHRVRAASGS
jgi:hypothetical protein